MSKLSFAAAMPFAAAVPGLLLALAAAGGDPSARTDRGRRQPAGGAYGVEVRRMVTKYCVNCHSAGVKRGGLDLERFRKEADLRSDLRPWQSFIDHLEVGDMPPPTSAQPAPAEKQRAIAWVRRFLAAEAAANAGDPGRVPLRRLSNAEYDCTIRDLTGVDLKPTREFPADGAAGEGFTNAAEALTEVSPDLLSKYFATAKEIAAHAVLLPDGFRFSPAKTRQDWTDESTERLRAFYSARIGADGRLPVAPYVAAAVRRRLELARGEVAAVAKRERLNAKYLGILWNTLNTPNPPAPLDSICARWRRAGDADAPALVEQITALQSTFWSTARVGSYVRPVDKGFALSLTRQIPTPLPVLPSVTLSYGGSPATVQSDITLSLRARSLAGDSAGQVLWGSARFEAPGQPPLLLRDCADWGGRYEVNLSELFANTAEYLAAAARAVDMPSQPAEKIADEAHLHPDLLKRWIALLALTPGAYGGETLPGRAVDTAPLTLLADAAPKDGGRAGIDGWRVKGVDLPILIANSTNTEAHVPGTVRPHGVAVHPTPTEFVAVSWHSPITGAVRVHAHIKHAHPACGNGVAWWLEARRGASASMFAEGEIELGGEADTGERPLSIRRGDSILLAVDAKRGDHACDLTDITLQIESAAPGGPRWDLAKDIADDVLAGNPHADRSGNAGIWSFVKGPSRPVQATANLPIPPGSVLDRWRSAVGAPNESARAGLLALETQRLLAGPRPAADGPDAALYDRLVSASGPLFGPLEITRLVKTAPGRPKFALDSARFGPRPGAESAGSADIASRLDEAIMLRLPAALLKERRFVVDCRPALPGGDRIIACSVSSEPSDASAVWDGRSPLIGSATGAAFRKATAGLDQFRACFPLFLCLPNVVPNDEVVSLKMFHREDEPLKRLFLNDDEKRLLDRLWSEHEFISRQAEEENSHLPLFIGFVTQDQPKEMVAFFEGQRAAFRARAEAARRAEEEAVPRQLEALCAFASRAYRGPAQPGTRAELLSLYRSVRSRSKSHDDAFRTLLARILVAPRFLFRLEEPGAGAAPTPVGDWELATRLSYFLWSSMPDDELRSLAAAGRLHDPTVLAAQTRRMLKDDRVRAMGIEFGAQWLHVRGFDELKEKNETLFPTFDAGLRSAIYEETIRFFQDLFQSDRPVTALLNADYTFLNDRLAKHYDIPGVEGPAWRRVDGVRKYGRGGILGLAAVLSKEAGASRTSPVLRGNWVVETLLGERLPRPPANVPKLPEEEGGSLTLRQQVERHTRLPECYVCHRRIDPIGFSLERYDPIGRLRTRDLSGLPVDARTKLADGTQFEGIDGLRAYLCARKQDAIVRLFCRRLLGYALGRSTINSDQPLIDAIVSQLKANRYRISSALIAIVSSRQFRTVRGRRAADAGR